MNSRVYEIEPSGPNGIVHHDTIGFYPMTFMGNPENTLPRLQRLADLAGFMLYATELMGQDTSIIHGQKARDALTPGAAFEETCRRHADAFMQLSYLEDFKGIKIGIGHSLTGAVISGMQLHGEQKPFDVVEICDGANLRGPEGPLGYGRYLGYQAMDLLQAKRRHATDKTKEEVLPAYESSDDAPEPPRQSFAAVIRAVGPLMRSSVGIDNLRALARDPAQPLHVIGYEHGVSGPVRLLNPFFHELIGLRALAGFMASGDDTTQGSRAPILVHIERGRWHSDLLKPGPVAANLDKSRRLVAGFSV